MWRSRCFSYGPAKTALKEEKEFTLELEKHIKYQDEQAEQDRLKAENERRTWSCW